MTHTRRQDVGLGKTAAGGSGGSFATHERSPAAPPPITSVSDEAELDEILRQRSERLARIAEKRAALEREEAGEQLELLSAKVEQLSEQYEIPPNFSDVQLNPSDENPGQYRFAGLRNEAGEYHVLDVDAAEQLGDFVDELGLYETSPLFENNERTCPILQLVDSSLPTQDAQRHKLGPVVVRPTSGTKSQSLSIPARQVDLKVGESPSWPEGWSMDSADFGDDESGRFFTSWNLRDQHGEERSFIYTDYESGSDFTYDDDLPWSDPEAMESISETVRQAHVLMAANSHVVGRGACERDPDLETQVKRVSLGASNTLSEDERNDWLRRERIAKAGIERPVTFTLLSPESQREWEDMQIERLDRLDG